MATNNKYNPITLGGKAASSNKYSPIATPDETTTAYGKAVASPFSGLVSPQASVAKVAAPTVAAPQETLGTKVAKAVLPKAAEDFFGLNGQPANPIGTAIKRSVKDATRSIFTPLLPPESATKAFSGAALNLLNRPEVQPVIKATAERTSGTGIVSAIQAAGPETFEQAYKANREAQAGDPSKLKQFLYQLGDTAPQTALGVALNFVPYAGKPLSTTYWTALSASEQLESQGKVTNLTNIGIDVALDRMLGGSIEALFKAPAKSLLSTVAKTFVVEGGTEVAQDLLKMANSYRESKSDAERQQILQKAKNYFTSGQILMTAGVGGLSGAGVGAGAHLLNQNVNIDQVISDEPIGGTPPPPPPGPDGPAGPPEDLAQTIRGTKGMTADQITQQYPDIRLTRDVPAKDIYGNKVIIPEGEALTPYELKGNRVVLQDGETYVVSKNQYQNIKGNSITNQAIEFAPELSGTQEVVKGGGEFTSDRDNLSQKRFNNNYDNLTGLEKAAIDVELNTLLGARLTPTKYSQYQLPGGENYKEILIKAPEKEPSSPQTLEQYFTPGNVVEGYSGKDKVIAFHPRTATQDWFVDVAEMKRDGTLGPIRRHATMPDLREKDTNNFQSSHWGEPNVLFHLRTSLRTYKGKKVLFVEEMQSDWAAEKRKGEKETPDHSLLKNWQEAAIKRALQEAVASNADYIAFINGEQTSARYDLATLVEEVKWGLDTMDGQQIKNINIKTKGNKYAISHPVIYVDDTGKIVDTIYADESWRGKNVDEVLGKGLADKIMSGKEGTLSGEGLKFGGEWADNLYDKQLPNLTSDITGGKVETIDMGLPVENNEDKFYKLDKNGMGSSGILLEPSDLVVGKLFSKNGVYYVITDVFGDGKFNAARKREVNKLMEEQGFNIEAAINEMRDYDDIYIESFNISPKESKDGQKAIKLTPEIKAKIKGEAPTIKTSGQLLETKPESKRLFIGNQLNKGTKTTADKNITKGRGYEKFSKYIDTAVKNGTFLPEDATILKTLFEETNDSFLGMMNYKDNGRLTRAAGRYSYVTNISTGQIVPGRSSLQMKKGLANSGSMIASKVFSHEFGHAAWHNVLTEQERSIITNIYNGLKKEERLSLFDGGSGNNSSYYASNVREFFAESFAEYVFENKVPAKQMEPLLKRVAGKFFEGLKRLVNRGEVEAVKRMQPLFEKILAGEPSTPLSEFAAKEPPSFKQELQQMFERLQPAFNKQALIEIMGQNGWMRGDTISPPAPTPAESPIGALDGAFAAATQSLPPDIASTIEPPQKVLQGEKNTPLKERVGILDYLRTPWKVFEKLGIRPQYQSLLKAYEAYVKELPTNINKITAWSTQVPKESNERIFRSLDGEKIDLNPEEARVAGEIKTWLSEWADRLGMAPDARISEYITHIFPIGKGGEIPEEIAYLINKKIPGSVYDPFLLQRQGAEGYLKDTWKALDAYVKRATRKVNMDPALAELKEASARFTDTSQLNYLNSYIGAVNMRPNALDTAVDNSIKKVFGYRFGDRPVTAFSRVARQMISRAKIGGSVVSFAKNLTQGVNTFAELGTRYTTIGYMDLVKYGRKELDENGVLIAPFIEDRTYSAVKRIGEKLDDVLFFNMNASELINRAAAYYGAKAKFIDGNITPKEYRNALGKDMPKDYTPTLEDAIAYGKFVAAKTQFLFGPLDTPVGMNSDIAKAVLQFQTFGLKQQEFIWNLLGQREYAKLARYLISSMLMFSTIASAFGMKWEDSFKTLRWGWPPIAQFIKDLYDFGVLGKDKYGNEYKTGQRIGGVAKSLFTNIVPAGASIQRGVEGFSTVKAGKATSPSGKFQYKVNKTPMNYIRGTLFGKYNLPEYKAYIDKQAGKKVKSTSSNNKYNPI